MTVPCVCLVVLDGWGLAPEGPGNAVALADTPVMDRIWAERPHTTLTACGEAVGLPAGQMGNSEVGHLNLGAGAVVKQDLTRIDEAVEGGTLAANPVLRAALEGAERVHLIGLVSDGGVHSSDGHLRALIALGAQVGAPDVVVHAFTDGRAGGNATAYGQPSSYSVSVVIVAPLSASAVTIWRIRSGRKLKASTESCGRMRASAPTVVGATNSSVSSRS